MDDCGIIDTNLPTVKVLWERRGRVMRLMTVNEPSPPYVPPWEPYVPPWKRPAPSDD
ncbi:hypothetical protein ACFQ9H_19470 [Streptomyces sp. NPDC056517]|uniref:hypothetical protein n=1 Tax=Streptomyces sp. NPDC056517 TaxID=3345848 RepID=UPI0036BE9EE8